MPRRFHNYTLLNFYVQLSRKSIREKENWPKICRLNLLSFLKWNCRLFLMTFLFWRINLIPLSHREIWLQLFPKFLNLRQDIVQFYKKVFFNLALIDIIEIFSIIEDGQNFTLVIISEVRSPHVLFWSLMPLRYVSTSKGQKLSELKVTQNIFCQKVLWELHFPQKNNE